jgi:hypothetical protein
MKGAKIKSAGDAGPPGLNKSIEIGSPADIGRPGSSSFEIGLVSIDSDMGRLIKIGVINNAARFFISS